jgi:hypothetical protein
MADGKSVVGNCEDIFIDPSCVDLDEMIKHMEMWSRQVIENKEIIDDLLKNDKGESKILFDMMIHTAREINYIRSQYNCIIREFIDALSIVTKIGIILSNKYSNDFSEIIPPPPLVISYCVMPKNNDMN